MVKESKRNGRDTLKEIANFLTWLKKVVSKHSKIQRILLFGSFARGDASPTSDIDLAFSLSDISEWGVVVQDIRENANTLRKLDLICFEKISGDFKKKILKEGTVIYERRQGKAKSSKF